MEYKSILVELKLLTLDIINPRFVVPVNPTQFDIIKYLLQYEEVAQLADGIVNSEGLLPGERPIVCRENGQYIVLEGNRRICACKLLSDRSLIPKEFDYIKTADKNLINKLKNIYVDIVDDRESVQSTLYNRHIQGVRDWRPIAKHKFYSHSFLAGKTLEYISKITSTPTTRVIKGIQQYQMLERVRSLKAWSTEEKQKLNDVNIEVDPFMRVFNSKSYKYNISAKKLFKVYYNGKYYPCSTYGDIFFDKALYLIAKYAFLETDKNKKLTTRKHIEHVPGLVDLLIDCKILSDNSVSQAQQQAAATNVPLHPVAGNTTESSPANSGPTSQPPLVTPSASANSGQTSSATVTPQNKQKSVQPFFGSLTWNGLDPNNQEEQGLINIAKEIRLMSTNLHYTKYPISAAILLRALFEQSLKHLIKRRNKWDDLLSFRNKQGPYDPMLGEIIKYLNHNFNYKVLIDKKPIQSSYEYAVRHENVVFFDTIIHNSFAILPTGNSLEEKANGGLLAIISYILNL